MKKYQNNFYLFIIHVLIQKEHNRQQADDWLWDTIPNSFIFGAISTKVADKKTWIEWRRDHKRVTKDFGGEKKWILEVR